MLTEACRGASFSVLAKESDRGVVHVHVVRATVVHLPHHNEGHGGDQNAAGDDLEYLGHHRRHFTDAVLGQPGVEGVERGSQQTTTDCHQHKYDELVEVVRRVVKFAKADQTT